MTIRQKNQHEIDIMTEGGKRLSTILAQTRAHIKAGQKLEEIDTYIGDIIKQHEAKPSFLGYKGYPANSCLSVNDVIVHGIPGEHILVDGDLLSIDIGINYKGYHTDAAFTIVIGVPSAEQTKLMTVTQRALRVGIDAAVAGNTVSDIGKAIEAYVKEQGEFGIIRDLTGHGIGKNLQEAPEIPNYTTKSKMGLINGMTIAIEPMITLGTWDITIDKDNWTIRSKDRSLAAHFETTIVIQDNDPKVLVNYPLELEV